MKSVIGGGEWNGRNWVDILGKTYGGTSTSIGTWSSLSSCLSISPPLMPDPGSFTLALVKLNYPTSESMFKKVTDDKDFEHELEEFEAEEMSSKNEQEEDEIEKDIKETGVPFFTDQPPTEEEKFDIAEKYGRLDDREDHLENILDEDDETDTYIPVLSDITPDMLPSQFPNFNWL